MLLHKPARNQNIPQSAILQCFLTALSQNHRVFPVGRDLFIQTVHLLTQYMETAEENYKEIIYLEIELYYSNSSEMLHLKN